MPGTTESQYREEQEQLRQKHGYGSSDQVHIEPPKRPEVNPEIFRDVEPYIFQGFLVVQAEINRVPFVFKSLNHHEFDHLNLLTKSHDARGIRDFYNRFLAHGVLLVDGKNVLANRDKWLHHLADFFKELEEGARRKVIRHMSEINRRASRAVLLTEAYGMETTSRFRWAQYKGLDLTSSAVTGIEGTQHLGLNWGQLTWRALNYYEDAREKTERDWENAKFIASAMAGSKGMSKVNGQDKQRKEKWENDRFDRRDKILRMVVLGEEPSRDPKKGAPLKVARTVEELADQLERDLRGEKDFHDMVVEAYENRIRQQHEDRLKKLQEFREDHRSKFGDRPVMGRTGMEGLTREEVQNRIVERQKQVANQLATTERAYPEMFDPKMDRTVNKWVGGSRCQQPQEVGPSAPDRVRVLPFKRGAD